MNILQNAITALSVGSLYALLALGLGFVASIMQLINFAHGELIMVAAYSVVFLADWNPVSLIAATLAVGVLLALASERIAFRPIRQADATTLFITSFALSYLLQGAARMVFGSIPKTTPAFAGLSDPIKIGSIAIAKLDIVTLGTTVVLLIGLSIFLTKTRYGIQMRAAAEDFNTARTLGVHGNRVIAIGFALSGLLAGVAAILSVAQSGVVSPTMGSGLVLIAFIASVLGGMGSLRGAVLGGYVLGVITVALQAYLPLDLRYYRDAIVFAAIIGLLVLRPQGLVPAKAMMTRV